MNITKEQMLERIREWKGAFDTHPDKMDEWSLCFMEDYKVYDAIRSLIESSSPSGNKAEGDKGGMTAKVTYVSECPQCGLPTTRADILVLDDEHAIDLSAPSAPSPAPTIKQDLTVGPSEVEEAMGKIENLLGGFGPNVFRDEFGRRIHYPRDTMAALAVIRAALTATIKPPLTVTQTTKVTREWVSWFVKTLFDMKMRGVTFPVEGAAETMLQSVGIEVEP